MKLILVSNCFNKFLSIRYSLQLHGLINVWSVLPLSMSILQQLVFFPLAFAALKQGYIFIYIAST